MKTLKYTAQLLLTIMLFVVMSAFAAPTAEMSNEAWISPSQASRVMVFDHTRHSLTLSGEILVCRMPNSATRSGMRCSGPGKPWAWEDLLHIDLPGYAVAGYQLRYVGAERVLLLYFKKL